MFEQNSGPGVSREDIAYPAKSNSKESSRGKAGAISDSDIEAIKNTTRNIIDSAGQCTDVVGKISYQLDLREELAFLIAQIEHSFHHNLTASPKIGFEQSAHSDFDLSDLQEILEAKSYNFQVNSINGISEQLSDATYAVTAAEHIDDLLVVLKASSRDGIVSEGFRGEVLSALLELRSHLVSVGVNFSQAVVTQAIAAEREKVGSMPKLAGTSDNGALIALEPDSPIAREIERAEVILNSPEITSISQVKLLLKQLMEFELSEPCVEKIGFATKSAQARGVNFHSLLEQLSEAAMTFKEDSSLSDNNTMVDSQFQIFAFNSQSIVDHLRLALIQNGAGQGVASSKIAGSFEMIREAKSQLFRNLAQIEAYRRQLEQGI